MTKINQWRGESELKEFAREEFVFRDIFIRRISSFRDVCRKHSGINQAIVTCPENSFKRAVKNAINISAGQPLTTISTVKTVGEHNAAGGRAGGQRNSCLGARYILVRSTFLSPLQRADTCAVYLDRRGNAEKHGEAAHGVFLTLFFCFSVFNCRGSNYLQRSCHSSELELSFTVLPRLKRAQIFDRR